MASFLAAVVGEHMSRGAFIAVLVLGAIAVFGVLTLLGRKAQAAVRTSGGNPDEARRVCEASLSKMGPLAAPACGLVMGIGRAVGNAVFTEDEKVVLINGVLTARSKGQNPANVAFNTTVKKVTGFLGGIF